MKMYPSLLRHLTAAAALAFAAATHMAFAQTATTTPVGFVTMAIAGNGGSGQSAYTFASLGVVNPIAFQSTATGVSGSIITDSAAMWADNAYNSTTAGAPPTHFLEVLTTTSGSNVGMMYDIVQTANAAKTVTVSGTLPADVKSYAIRQHWTVGSVFGPTVNQAGGLAGGSAAGADQVQLFRNGNYVGYFYQTAGRNVLLNAWVSASNLNADASNTVIYPDDGILIIRNQSTAASIVLSGAVKTGQTSIPVQNGYTLLGNVYSAGMTLGNSHLVALLNGNPATPDTANGLAGGSAATADQVIFWNGANFVQYFYQTAGRNVLLNTWVSASDLNADASSTPIPVGAALFIQRSGAPFSWVAPQFPATFN